MIETKTMVHISNLLGTNKNRTTGAPKEMFTVVRTVGHNRSILKSMITVNKTYTPAAGDKIFFLPGCNVPRFKVKQFCETFDSSLVKYKEKANVKFIGPETVNELVRDLSYYRYEKRAILGYLAKHATAAKYQPLIQALYNSTSEFVTFEEYGEKEIIETRGAIGPPIKLDNKGHSNDLYFTDEKSYEQFVSMMTDVELCDQNEILKRINTGGVMDKERYDSIRRMFISTDDSDLKLAMEAMANSDYEKSSIYLLLLIQEFGSKMEGSKTKNHVNFKSLLKFFEINGLSSLNLDSIIRCLLKRKLLNTTNLEILRPKAMEILQDKVKTAYFEATGIVVTQEIIDGINENILDEDLDTEIVEEPLEQLTIKFNMNLGTF